MKNLNEFLMDGLKKFTKVTEADVRKAVALYSNKESGKIGEALIQMGLVTEKDLRLLLSVELKITTVSLADKKISSEIGKMVPERYAKRYLFVPLSNVGNTLTLAMVDPLNIFALDDVSVLKNNRVECVMCSEGDVQLAFDRIYGRVKDKPVTPETGVKPLTAAAAAAKVANTIGDVRVQDETDSGMFAGETNQAPVVKIVDAILQEALRRRASDIHIEPYEEKVRVRFRIDGGLQEAQGVEVPKKNQNAVLTRLKIMSKLDITENRIPQDGRFKIKFQQDGKEKEIDFRVSILPIHHGSKVVMRILDKSALSLGLDNLGFLPETLNAFKDAVAKPFGMILITGPTGSGKSTTLYSILNQLNTPDKNIITVEEPIEYQVRGISQIQVRQEIGLDFASGLRAILRQSPDVVMVGEIRDGETADIAIKASLTGQIVLSTLHTNDASGAVTRLADMGIEPFLIASSVILVAAQRLCRKVCSQCKQPIDIPREVFERMGLNPDTMFPDIKEKKFMKGVGCENCSFTGYRGRMGVLETLMIDDELRELIVKRASSYEIKDYAVKHGMTTLREDALKKFCLGSTTLDEVIRITAEDE